MTADERLDRLAPVLVRNADHRGLTDGLVLGEHIFDLARPHLVAGHVDLVLLAIDDVNQPSASAARAVKDKTGLTLHLPQWFDPLGAAAPQEFADLYVAFALDLVGFQPAGSGSAD